MNKVIAFGVVCLAGLGAIGATAKKSASPLSEMFNITGKKLIAFHLQTAGHFASDDWVDATNVSSTDRSKSDTIQSGNQPKSGLAPSTIVPRHWHDPNAKRAAVVSPDRRIKIQDPKKRKNVDRAKTSVDLRPCRRPEGFAGLLRALNLSPGRAT